MEKIAVITVDIEPDCDVKWRRSNPLKFNSVLVGIKDILQPLFDKYIIRPVYFISPEITDDKGSIEILKKISDENKCEIGNHLHGEYVEPQRDFFSAAGTHSHKHTCFDYTDEVESAKIQNLDRRLREIFGKKITSFRAGKYGADINTIRSLATLGYTVDSSVTPNIDWSAQGGPDYRHFPDQPYRINLNDFIQTDKKSPILEVPITVGKKRFWFLPNKWLFYRWLRPTFMFVWEEKKLIDDFIQQNENRGRVTLCLMFHSMELIPRATPFVHTWLESYLLRKRLEQTIKYLIKKGFVFKTLAEISQ